MIVHFAFCVVRHTADGSCVSLDQCHCKLTPAFYKEIGVPCYTTGTEIYPPGTVIMLNCKNW